MNRYTFSTQTGKAYYCNSIPGFIADRSTDIVGRLIRHAFDINKEQANAWENQIAELQRRLEECGMKGDIIFEYDIVRLGKRIDVILLIRHMVFSLEFKNGKDIFTAQDAQQAEDYAIDIKNFHKESEDLYVCPILIATDAAKYAKAQSKAVIQISKFISSAKISKLLFLKLQKSLYYMEMMEKSILRNGLILRIIRRQLLFRLQWKHTVLII